MIHVIGEAARSFRLGQESAGSDAMVRIVDSLGFLAEDPARSAALLPVIQLILSAQGRGDYLLVADLLLHELAPALDAEEGLEP